MEYFDKCIDKKNIFLKKPGTITKESSKEMLSYGIGALLYTSVLRKNLLSSMMNLRNRNCNSIALCLEDATSSKDLKKAEVELYKLLESIKQLQKREEEFCDKLPLIFIRVKNENQLLYILNNFYLDCVCGIIIPKINNQNAEKYFGSILNYNIENKKKLYMLPVLETPEIAFKETRLRELLKLKECFDKYKEYILNIRVGATDLSGIFGLRRNFEQTVYDINVVSDCLTDILNIFIREDYIVSGAVFECFISSEFKQHEAFYKEIELDRANGVVGKTVIHPMQVAAVNTHMVVKNEEYRDAKAIIDSEVDGVIKSDYRNKMNEIKPHIKWAEKILKKAEITGVYNYGKSAEDLLEKIRKSSIRNNVERY